MLFWLAQWRGHARIHTVQRFFLVYQKLVIFLKTHKEGEIRLSAEVIELKAYKNKNLPITALNKHKEVHSYDSCIDTISFELDILGEPAHFRINITESQVRLTDIVPLARKVSTKITKIVVERERRSGQNIPCRQGCSACCNFLVPLSVPEALCL